MKTQNIIITQEILNLIASIDEFKGAWQALCTIAPERLLALKKVATIESIGSSTRIEGSKLSDIEIEKILAGIEVQKLETRDEQEIIGYSNVMEIIFESWQEIPLTENYIKQLHAELLKYSDKDQAYRRKYKVNRNNISASDASGKNLGTILETASTFDTPRLMESLILSTNNHFEDKTLHPLIVCALFIVTFLEIHPFHDGNGRLSRVLTILLLLKSGYNYAPYSSLENIVEQSKENYYRALRKTQKTIRSNDPDWHPWILFFLKTLDNQVKRLRKKIEHEKILLHSMSALSTIIIDYIKNHGRVTLSEIVKISGANRNTMKKHFQSLVAKNQIYRHGKGRGVWYSLT